MAARARNWRLEVVAWLAAVALVVGALAFSGVSDDGPEQNVQEPPRPAAEEAPSIVP